MHRVLSPACAPFFDSRTATGSRDAIFVGSMRPSFGIVARITSAT